MRMDQPYVVPSLQLMVAKGQEKYAGGFMRIQNSEVGKYLDGKHPIAEHFRYSPCEQQRVKAELQLRASNLQELDAAQSRRLGRLVDDSPEAPQPRKYLHHCKSQ